MQSELNQLQRRMAQLEREVRALKWQRWALFGFLLALGIASAAIGGTTTAPSPPQPQDIVCKSLKLIDRANRATVILGSDQDGGIITVAGTDGKARVSIAVDQDGGGLELAGNDKKPRVTLGADAQGGLAVFFDGKGVFKARLP